MTSRAATHRNKVQQILSQHACQQSCNDRDRTGTNMIELLLLVPFAAIAAARRRLFPGNASTETVLRPRAAMY